MGKHLRHWVALVAVTALLGALSMAAPAPAAGSPPGPATFNPNLLLQGSNGAGEPSIRTDQFGQPFVIGPIGVPAGCKAFRVRHDGSGSKFLGFPDSTAGGGDCDWAIGPQEISSTISPPPSDNDLAYSSLTLANITTGNSDDGGNSFGPPNPYSQQVAGDDRMWMTADPKLNSLGFDDVYMIYHDVSVLDIQLGVSRDGGFSYVQNGPIINNADVPPSQWLGGLNSPPDPAGNGIGNIEARRDPATGILKLYSIFLTTDSATDNVVQGANGTANFNRVWEAVGTVTDVPAPGAPVISWRNYEIYHGPCGALASPCVTNYDRLFPVTTVDKAGKVYAFWSDGYQILYKTDATGTGWNPATAPSMIPNPAGANFSSIMPWAQAGKSGIVDVVFYGATATTAPADPNNPQDNPDNVWKVYFAQSIDGGASWGVFQANDHGFIHKGDICIHGLGCDLFGGDRTLLDFFQVSIDPTNGAADIAYTDDSASPGSPVLYFTRQCTGTSATTGQALVNDCVAPPPLVTPPQGTECPGPQILDFVNDAPNNYIGGMGQNLDNLDIETVDFVTLGTGDLQITMTIKDLEAPPTASNPNIGSALWNVFWTFNGTDYDAQATTNGTGSSAVAFFFAGPVGSESAVSGTFNPGPNGTFVFDIPPADTGNPPAGNTAASLFTKLSADAHGSYTVGGAGLFFTAPADRAPDSGFGHDWHFGNTCTPPPPPPAPTALDLEPKTETDNLGTQACVTATVTGGTSGTTPVPNITVRFSVTGVSGNPGPSGSGATDQFGQARFCYTNQTTPGNDTITAFADTSNDGVRQSSEPQDTTTKTWVRPVTTPGCTITITNGGWIKADNGDKASFGGNAKSSASGATSGQEEYQDKGPAANMNVKSTNVLAVQCNSPTDATIFGQATVNGSGSHSYRIDVHDGAANGTKDQYGIMLDTGYNSGEHTLGGGNVNIHK